MTVRRAAALAAHLPPGSAVFRALGVDAAWTMEAHALAAISDGVAAGNWQRGGGKGARPKPAPRPSDIKAAEDKRERERLRAIAYRNRHATRRGQE